MIKYLLDEPDKFEIILNSIEKIISNEIKNQVKLARINRKNYKNWDIRILKECSAPLDVFQGIEQLDGSVVNICFAQNNYILARSNSVDRQHTEGTYHLDCYDSGSSRKNTEGGHIPGDRVSAINVYRTSRLIRNILMASDYRRLSLPKIIERRWIESMSTFQMSSDERPVLNISCMRIVLNVSFEEFSPQIPEKELETVSIEVSERNTKEIIIKHHDVL